MCEKFKSESELLNYTSKILYKNVKELFPNYKISTINKRNKGKLGQMIEKDFFGYELNNERRPDFKELGIELKVVPLLKTKSNFRPKERIKLTQLDINDVIKNESIVFSNTWKKIQKTLFIWYSYSNDFFSNKFEFVNILNLNSKNHYLEVIQKDWSILRSYLLDGEAHKISESLTKYLGLARSGSGGLNEKKIEQPYGQQPFFRRAFTFKYNFVKLIFDEMNQNQAKYEYENNDFVSVLRKKFLCKHIGDFLNEDELKISKPIPKSILPKIISNEFDSKSFSELSKKVFNEYGYFYTFKTVPLLKNEDGSFKLKESFKLNIDILQNIDKKWDESDFSKVFENKFVIITYIHNSSNRLRSVINDIIVIDFADNEIESVIYGFHEFKDRYYNGGLIDKNGNLNFIKSKDDLGIHFRPSALNSKDKFVSPAGESAVKTKIWFNNNLILKKIVN